MYENLVKASYSAAEIIAFKDAFAKLRAAGVATYEAAVEVMGNSFWPALQWDDDVYVIQQKSIYQRTDNDFANGELMSRSQYLLACKREMFDMKMPPDHRYKMFALYGRVSGFLDDGKSGGGVNNGIINNGVIVLPSDVPSDDWTINAEAQQRKLIASVKD